MHNGIQTEKKDVRIHLLRLHAMKNRLILFKLKSERKPDLIRLLGILQIIHIFKNKANKAKPKHQIGI
jgi:hypothetical protein